MSNNGRVGRLLIWIPLLTLAPAAGALAFTGPGVPIGLASGGIIVVLNLVGTQRTVLWLIEGEGTERIVATLVWFGKFSLTAVAILGLLYTHLVEPVALLIGLGALPVSIVFDIFLFPVNKGGAKKPKGA